MKYQFASAEEYDILWDAIHSAILYWKKVRQDCQGKICLQVDGSETHYSEKYAIDMIVQNAKILEEIEKSPHPIWNEETNRYEIGVESYGSVIIDKALRLANPDNGVDKEDDPELYFGSEYESGISYGGSD